jgi:hypothetical protein
MFAGGVGCGVIVSVKEAVASPTDQSFLGITDNFIQ